MERRGIVTRFLKSQIQVDTVPEDDEDEKCSEGMRRARAAASARRRGEDTDEAPGKETGPSPKDQEHAKGKIKNATDDYNSAVKALKVHQKIWRGLLHQSAAKASRYHSTVVQAHQRVNTTWAALKAAQKAAP